MRLSKPGNKKISDRQSDGREPIGIVIADGGRGDKQPRLSAFVWGPVPEDASTVAFGDATTAAFAE